MHIWQIVRSFHRVSVLLHAPFAVPWVHWNGIVLVNELVVHWAGVAAVHTPGGAGVGGGRGGDRVQVSPLLQWMALQSSATVPFAR